MFSSRDAYDNDFCPVRDELLGEMYRANENGLPQLVESVSSDVRAMLALFCYRRSHLHSLALSIAASCSERELIEFGGRVGSTLYALSREAPSGAFARVIVLRQPQADHALDQTAQHVLAGRGRTRRRGHSRKPQRPDRRFTCRASSRRRTCNITSAPATRAVVAPCRIRHRRACRSGRLRAAPRKSRMTVATPILPDSAEQRSPSQRIPDSLSLTNFSGMRSSAASSSVVKRGQFDEYEQQAPQAWQGLSASAAGSLFSMASFSAEWTAGQPAARSSQVSLGGSQTRLCRHFARRASRRSGYFSSR